MKAEPRPCSEHLGFYGLAFDLDGTLYDSHRLKWRFIRASLSSYRETKLLLISKAVQRLAICGVDFASGEELRRAYYAAVARYAGLTPDRVADWYECRFYDLFTDLLRAKYRPRPALNGFLIGLKRSGKKLAVVSNFSRIDERLESLRISPELFDCRVSGEEIGALKPSPRALRTAAEGLGLPCREVLSVGDRAGDDEAARRAGMPFIRIRRRSLTSAGRHALTWESFTQSIAA